MDQPREASSNQEVQERARIRSQFRSITGTTFLLVVILAFASWVKMISISTMYVLFALIFFVDFSLQTYVVWKNKIYWISSRRIITGKKARIIAIGYALLSVVCLLLGIIVLVR